MTSVSEGVAALETFLRQVGIPCSTRNDNSQMQTGYSFMDVCNFYSIGTELTEPHNPQQNPAENRIGTLKAATNCLMDRIEYPEFLWLQAILYMSMLLNVVAHCNIGWGTFTEVEMGYAPDIPPFYSLNFLNLSII